MFGHGGMEGFVFVGARNNVNEEVVLDAKGDVRCINVEKGRWHSLVYLEPKFRSFSRARTGSINHRKRMR